MECDNSGEDNLKMKTVAIIPARGGSKRIPRKNIKLLNGKPLIAYVIEASLKAYHFNGGVYVSTDDSEIKNISQKYGALVIDRPTELATDLSTTEEVIAHFLKQVPCDILVIIEATHPVISTADINGALTKFFEINCDIHRCVVITAPRRDPAVAGKVKS